jgi:4-hydroxybenzoyl-CoA reductase subunit beta
MSDQNTLTSTYTRVKNVNEAVNAVAINGAKFIAGGTDIMVNKFQENENSNILIDISEINELKNILWKANDLHIGSLVKLDEIYKNKEIQKEIPALSEAAHSVGTPLLRKSATIGGNLLCENRCLYYNQSAWWREAVGHCLKCNGDICIATGGPNACFSEFVSDTAPILISMQAKLEIQSLREGKKYVDLNSIYTGDGVKPRNINHDTLITNIVIPLAKNYKTYFRKLRLRESLEFTSLTMAVSVDKQNSIRICLAGMDPKPVYLETTKEETPEEINKKLLKMSRAVDNDYFSRKYRRDMVMVFLKDAYSKLKLI